MKDLQIAVTFWNRFSERLDCLKKAYESIETNMLFGKYTHEWIISCETDRCVERDKIEEFFNLNKNIKYIWKEDTASLHSNLNSLFKKCVSPILFYLQDDWILTRSINLEDDIKFFIESDYDMIRYCYFNRNKDDLKLINKNLELYEISYKTLHFYSDHPHMKKGDFHKKYGFFSSSTDRGYDTGDCENKFNGMMKQIKPKILFKGTSDGLFIHNDKRCSTLKEKWEHHPTIIAQRKKIEEEAKKNGEI
jgi:hypothetical protein